MANELLIKINADAKNAEKAFDDMREKTEDLEGTLSKVALVSAAAFAALTAEVLVSVKAFEDGQKSAVQLTNALQNQGIYTEELSKDLNDYAENLSKLTGIDDDAIVKSQALAQSFLGQTAVTEPLTKAIVDLGAYMGGDLNAAAEKIGRTIGTSTNAFARQGLVIDETASKAERMATVLEFVKTKAGGLAEEMNKADGYSKALGTSFDDMQKALGSRFAPAVAAIRETFVNLFTYISESPVLLDLAAAFIAAGIAVSGITAILAAAVPAFLALSAAAATFGVAMNVALVGIPLLIGAIVAGVVLLALNWDKTTAFIRATSTGLVTFLSELFGGLGSLLKGVFTFNMDKMKEGLEQMKNALGKARDEAKSTYTEIRESQAVEGQKQNTEKAAFAAKQAALEEQHQNNLRAIRAGTLALLKMQNENASAAAIALKSKELETLKALDDEKNASQHALLKQRLEIITKLQDEQAAEDIEKAREFGQIRNDTIQELGDDQIQIEGNITEQRLAQIRATVQTEKDIDRKLQEDILAKRIQQHNTQLLEAKKFGKAYATINAAMHSDELVAANDLTGNIVGMANSKNQTLKTIGQVGASASIAIKTAQGAMAAFADSVLLFGPVVGPIVGGALAAALVAYGAEQEANVWAAAKGGVVAGGTAGVDSVPAMLMPGEVVVPTKDFSQLRESIAAQTGGDTGGATQNNGGGGVVQVVLSLKDDLAKFIESKLVERQRLGISVLTTKLA